MAPTRRATVTRPLCHGEDNALARLKGDQPPAGARSLLRRAMRASQPTPPYSHVSRQSKLRCELGWSSLASGPNGKDGVGRLAVTRPAAWRHIISLPGPLQTGVAKARSTSANGNKGHVSSYFRFRRDQPGLDVCSSGFKPSAVRHVRSDYSPINRTVSTEESTTVSTLLAGMHNDIRTVRSAAAPPEHKLDHTFCLIYARDCGVASP